MCLKEKGDFLPMFNWICLLPELTSSSTIWPPAEITMERCPRLTSSFAISRVPRSTPPPLSAGSS